MGFEKFLGLVEERLGAKLVRVQAEAVAARPKADRAAHIGVHAQKQKGLNWIGVVLPVGKLTGEQMRGLATVAQDLGDGDIRLTVWQNLLISGVPADKVALAEAAIEALGLATRQARSAPGWWLAPAIPAAASPRPTPRAMPNRSRAGARRASNSTRPVNIHLTGCHHSCAQHYIGDIGLLACKVPVSEEDDRSRAITSWSAAAPAGCDTGARIVPRREGRRCPAHHRSACSRPIFRAALRATRRFMSSPRRHDDAALGTLFAECRS